VAQKLIQDGNGVVTFNFSVQPLSLATLKSEERPAFYEREVTLETLAGEAEGVAEALSARYGIRNAIPVSLSYTSAVSRHLGFDRMIDSVPLTSTDAFSPELAMYRNWLKAGELLNPVFGPSITRAALDAVYRPQWAEQVQRISEQFRLPSERHDDMIEGYIRLSRAVEGFEWKNAGDRAERAFVLAGNESPTLLRHQLEVARERLQAGRKESIFFVQESGHVVPAEQPLVYARILELVAAGKALPGVTLITPSRKEWKTLSIAESIDLLEQTALSLPALPAGSRSSAPDNNAIPGTL
jgi:pimeloyl-ACP methyl ester carboxylesterase